MAGKPSRALILYATSLATLLSANSFSGLRCRGEPSERVRLPLHLRLGFLTLLSRSASPQTIGTNFTAASFFLYSVLMERILTASMLDGRMAAVRG
uniref:Secreted protein n=1 Tax=Setaria viridis TaxID=4556 RepID=A0A4U6U1Y1_SETVI|nr:hypothetical protein SEVIR_6G108280v2 [Setaria viridis]